jgi:Ca2+-binding EF-hand superfamily protein
MQDAMRGSLPQDGRDGGRGAPEPGSSSKSTRSRSRRNNSRSKSKTGDNAITSNPLLQLFDENGDGELSLKEIDAASRLLYSLDTNEDDRITAEEVEDMVVEGGASKSMAKKSSRDEDEDDEPPRSRQSTRKRSTASRGSNGSRSARAMGKPTLGTMQGMNVQKNEDDDDFAGNDRNKDGILKRGELPKSYRNDFRKMDANGDGGVDEDEFYDFIDG